MEKSFGGLWAGATQENAVKQAVLCKVGLIGANVYGRLITDSLRRRGITVLARFIYRVRRFRAE